MQGVVHVLDVLTEEELKLFHTPSNKLPKPAGDTQGHVTYMRSLVIVPEDRPDGEPEMYRCKLCPGGDDIIMPRFGPFSQSNYVMVVDHMHLQHDSEMEADEAYKDLNIKLPSDKVML